MPGANRAIFLLGNIGLETGGGAAQPTGAGGDEARIAPSRCCDCEQPWLIVRAASTLSNALRKVADNCYPEKETHIEDRK
jgi:hypothetical protein